MANISNIVIDLSSGTATLTITNASLPLETITFTSSTNQIVFANRSLINISSIDFLNCLSQFYIFQQAILNNFPQNIFLTSPFSEVQNAETNNAVGNSWNFYSVNGLSPIGRTVDYSALGANKTVNINNRQFPITLSFPEWIYLLQALVHYNASVKSFFSL
jgi:hypothetical protein